MNHTEKTGTVRRNTRPAILILALFLTLTASGGGGGETGGKEETGGKGEATQGEARQGETTRETASDARSYVLPGDEVYPEGVALNEATGEFFVGSTTDSTIFRGNVVEPGAEAEVFLEPGGGGRTTAVGIEFVLGAGSVPVAGYSSLAGIPGGSSSTMPQRAGWSARARRPRMARWPSSTTWQ